MHFKLILAPGSLVEADRGSSRMLTLLLELWYNATVSKQNTEVTFDNLLLCNKKLLINLAVLLIFLVQNEDRL